MLKFQATYRMKDEAANPLVMFFPGIVEHAPNRTMSSTRLLLRVFELTGSELEQIQAGLKSRASLADTPAKLVKLYLEQETKRMMPSFELVRVIQIPEPLSFDEAVSMASHEANCPCALHNPGNPANKDPWGYRF